MAPVAVICGTFVVAYWPSNWTVALAAVPVTITSPGLTLERLSSAVLIAVAGASAASCAVVWPLKVSVNAAVARTVCDSAVFWSLWGEKPPELPAPDGVSSPVTSHRLLWVSKSMSPATWQHAPRLLETRRIFCSDARSIVGFAPSTNLKRLSWK